MSSIALLRRRAMLAQVHGRSWVGPTGVAGLLLLALAAGAAWWAPRVEQDAAALHRQFEMEGVRLQQRLQKGAADPATQVQEFYDAFPRAGQNIADLRAIFRIAHDQNVRLPRGDYATAHRTEAPITTCDVVLPVRASYAAIRAFVASILNELPHASLAELRLERGNADQLEARVHLTLYYRED